MFNYVTNIFVIAFQLVAVFVSLMYAEFAVSFIILVTMILTIHCFVDDIKESDKDRW